MTNGVTIDTTGDEEADKQISLSSPTLFDTRVICAMPRADAVANMKAKALLGRYNRKSSTEVNKDVSKSTTGTNQTRNCYCQQR